MKEYCFTVECESRSHTTVWVTREFKYLVGDQCPEGSEFIQALGMWDNFSVAGGQNTQAWTEKSRERLIAASERLLERVRLDREYIHFDYQVGFAAEGRRRHSGRGFGVRLPGGNVSIRLHPGQAYMQFHERGSDGKFHVVRTTDLRKSDPIQTEDKGLMKVYRRRNPLNWEEKLPLLIGFLLRCSAEFVRIRHHYPEPS